MSWLQLNEVRHGFRILRKSPGWATVMGSTLALGIGLATVIFGLAYSLLLRSLPYPEHDRLVALWTTSSASHLVSMERFNVGGANWTDWRAQSKSFEDISLTRLVTNFSLTGDGPPERVQGAKTWCNLLRVLDVQPMLGRMFTEEEDRAEAKVAVISYGFWTRHFGRDSAILGRKIQLNGVPYEVIGVMPSNFWYPTREFELWVPLYLPQDDLQSRWDFYYRSVGRLKPGVSLQQAQDEMSGIMRRLGQQYYASNGATKLGVIIDPLMDSTVGQFRKTIYVLLGAVGCLLLIVCINLGGLLIVRANARGHEFAIRAALGANADRLRKQTLAEVLPLSIIGCVGGVLLAWLLLKILMRYLPFEVLSLGPIGLHIPVLAASLVLSLLVVMAAAMLPARMASRLNISTIMQQASRTVAGGGTIRNALVIAQIAVTLVVVFAGGLLVRSLVAVVQTNPGFSPQGVLTMHMAVLRAKYPTDAQVIDYYRRVIARVKSIPGVAEAAVINVLPLSGLHEDRPLKIEGRPDEGLVDVDSRAITPGYFSAMGIPVIRGRDFSEQDTKNSPPVGIIDEQLARKIWGTQDPLGKRFQAAVGVTEYSPWIQIIGVVGHTRNETLETDPRPQMYWPQAQQTQDRAALVVRTSQSPESLAHSVVEQIHRENPEQSVYDVRSMEDWRDRSLQSRNLLTGLVVLFAGAALLLACIGLYGVVSYAAGLRLREFAVRIAIGAQPSEVRRLVLSHAIKLWIIGAALGLIVAWPAGRAFQSLLYGVGSTDLTAVSVAPFLLLVTALLAGIGPARRVGRVDPAVTLRGE
jgi:putative ABC transport system permease protein